MRVIAGVLLTAVLFGLYTALRPSENGCTGHCAGCTGDGACDKNGAPR